MALDSAHAVTGDVDLIGDTVSIALKDKKAEATRAWGKKQRPVGVAGDYELRGDSLAIDTPKGELREVRAYYGAWAGTKPDSGTGERDWVAGDTVIIRFVEADSAGKKTTKVRQLEAMDSARSFYRAASKGKADSTRPKPPSLNYARADRIVVSMLTTGDGGMDRVDMYGHVDGIQLEPEKPKAPGRRAGRAEGQHCRCAGRAEGQHCRGARRRRRTAPPLHRSRSDGGARRGNRPQQELPWPSRRR